MAVPTGTYEVEAAADLSPLFGKVTGRARVRVEQPGPNALDEVIARLATVKPEDRWEIVEELELFTDDGDRVVPILLGIIADPRGTAPYSAIYALRAFPDHARESIAALLPLVTSCERIGSAAASVIGDLEPRLHQLARAYCDAHHRGQMTLVRKAAKAIRRFLES